MKSIVSTLIFILCLIADAKSHIVNRHLKSMPARETNSAPKSLGILKKYTINVLDTIPIFSKAFKIDTAELKVVKYTTNLTGKKFFSDSKGKTIEGYKDSIDIHLPANSFFWYYLDLHDNDVGYRGGGLGFFHNKNAAVQNWNDNVKDLSLEYDYLQVGRYFSTQEETVRLFIASEHQGPLATVNYCVYPISFLDIKGNTSFCDKVTFLYYLSLCAFNPLNGLDTLNLFAHFPAQLEKKNQFGWYRAVIAESNTSTEADSVYDEIEKTIRNCPLLPKIKEEYKDFEEWTKDNSWYRNLYWGYGKYLDGKYIKDHIRLTLEKSKGKYQVKLWFELNTTTW